MTWNRKLIPEIRRIVREEFDRMYDASSYLDDFYAMDFNEEMYDEEQALERIQKEIEYVKGLKYPVKVYRGINTINPKSDYEGASWSTDIRVAEGFGNRIYVGLINGPEAVDFEQTVRTRVMNPGEKEIYVPDFDDVEIIGTYDK